MLVQPLSASNVLFAIVANVRDRPTKRGEAEPQRDQEEFEQAQSRTPILTFPRKGERDPSSPS